ncbi:hypothetical protein [Kingella oralis]|uniref:hypothetical protein n=1 Tax=Kingella oralis TaxID=505 RepID=UPI0012DF46A1|nr:hypothetical protein [Kingella oralis]QMT41827.1 hypothetical protein H3L93_07130 [Kingella oralis]
MPRGKAGFYTQDAPTSGQSAFQAETFVEPATDGASAARRHLGKPVMLCFISHLAASRRSILNFRLLFGSKGFQAAYFSRI